jgi:murein DD-endopeptidase MepM/ murein hydrolase activator NlpD
MINYPIDSLPPAANQRADTAKPLTSQEALATEFKDIFTTLILGMSLADRSQSSSAFTSQLAPLLMGLIEHLLGQEEGQEVGEVASEAVIPSGMPITGRLTQNFHSGHLGLDFGAPVGTPVRATMGGKVVYAGWNNEGYGNLVIVENGAYRTYYAHLSNIPVSVGQHVQPGTVIGLSGNTGNSTGPHLHYEVRVNGQGVDPRRLTLP